MNKIELPLFAVVVFTATLTFAAPALVPAPRSLASGKDSAAADARVEYLTDASLPAEGYRLVIGEKSITVTSADAAGRYYAERTLEQLREDGPLPCLTIDDAPAYRWRGMHMDVCRHFFDKEAVKRTLDVMAYFKMNRLHWHLTDDQGWRLDIPGYPKLIKYGAVVAGQGPKYYTEADLKEIIAYAAERHIQIVPEVEAPGHFQAAIAAYPEFSCFPAEHDGEVRHAWGVSENVMCVSNPQAVRFMEDVLDYVCRVFPSDIIHIGGDECPRTVWKRCPRCQAFMKRDGMKDENGLQAWVTRHFVDFLAARGKRTLGWDEYLYGDVPASAIGMVWRVSKVDSWMMGVVDPAVEAARGHDLVMCPSSWCYLDFGQTLPPRGQGTPNDGYTYLWEAGLTLQKAYSFNPMRGMPENLRSHVLGGQGNNWSEMTENLRQLQWKMWPRGAALAEVLWSGENSHPFADFYERVKVRRDRLVARGVNCAPVSAAAPTELHVSPNAAPGGDGSAAKPFDALWPAQSAARWNHCSDDRSTFTIWVHGGEYRLSEPHSLNELDNSVVWKAAPGETPKWVRADPAATFPLVKISEAKDIWFEGIAFGDTQDAAIQIEKSSGCGFTNCRFAAGK